MRRSVRVVLDYRPALRQRTGVGEYAHEMSRALRRQLAPSDDLMLFSSSWKDRLPAGVIPGAIVVDARIPVTVLNAAWHRLEWPPIEQFAGPVDVAHSLHPLLMPARGAAQVVTVHDLHFLDNPGNASAEIRRDYPTLTGAHARRADAVITVSEYTAGRIRTQLGVPSDVVSICPPGAPPWERRREPTSNGPILFMGTIEPRKNVPVLLGAYEALVTRRPDAPPLILAGNVTPACQVVLERIQQLPLAGRVRHVGYVSGAEREKLYREASMLVLPSLDEGFGMPVLEAMTLGVPAVISNRGALPEVAGDAALVVDAEDPRGLAAAMERLLGDPALAARSADAGVARSRQFSWDTSAARLLKAYASAIERRTRR